MARRGRHWGTHGSMALGTLVPAPSQETADWYCWHCGWQRRTTERPRHMDAHRRARHGLVQQLGKGGGYPEDAP